MSNVADLHAVLMYGVRNMCSRLGYSANIVANYGVTCLSTLISCGKASKARYWFYALEPLTSL
ncbi:hypothetical protein PspLS_03041 [Pyricularia sp. CBS 133598]|nr:hypothetical protein PspLS_03041 [Pyricularia sp. CBS 133598]